MQGTNAQTGKPLSGKDHCKQSVRDILTTPKGSRVMLRSYGGDLFDLVDKPMNGDTRLDMIAATADALAQWEPRIDVKNVSVSANSDGEVFIDVDGNYLPDGTPIRIDGIQVK